MLMVNHFVIREICQPVYALHLPLQVLACMVFTSMGVTAMMLGRRPSDPVSRILAGLVAAGCMLPCRILLPRLYKSANAPLDEKELQLTVTDVHTQQQQQRSSVDSVGQQRRSQQRSAPQGSLGGKPREGSRPDRRIAKDSATGSSAAVVPDCGHQPEGVTQKAEEVRRPQGTLSADAANLSPANSHSMEDRRLRIQTVVRVRAWSPPQSCRAIYYVCL
jgi:hypothetical protein